MALSPLNQRRWRNFTRNRRAYWSLLLFSIAFFVTLFAEVIANDRPILVNYQGSFYVPVAKFYPETAFGGDFKTEADYKDPVVQCLIETGGVEICLDEPEEVLEQVAAETFQDDDFQQGWTLWPPIPYSFDTPVDRPGAAPLPPNGQNWLGTDDRKRDVLARIIYGFRLSILFTLIVTSVGSVFGIIAGAVQGYFGGWVDLIFQRVIEIWGATPQLYVIIILFAILGRSFWLLVFVTVLFGWTALFTVDERQEVILFQFGEIIESDYEPGLHIKFPFINNVRKFDNRILTIDQKPERFLTKEKKDLILIR